MKDYLNEVNVKYPIRRRAKEKADFYEYVRLEIGEDRVKKETLEGQHNNIVIGEISEAKVVFTAHYDTPARSLIPNMMFPANKVKGTLFHVGYALLIVTFCLLIAFGISRLAGLGDTETMLIYLVLYFGFFYASTMLITNKHNKNDNTSGVATILDIASVIDDKNVAFVLFDNEEKGLLGSKALNKKYKNLFENKLVVNFDCVGNGDQIIVIAKDKAENLPEFQIMKKHLVSDDGFEIHHIPFKKSNGNSDHKSFPCGVGVVASRKGKLFKFVTGRIHTERDTVAESKNVRFLAEKMRQFVKEL